MTLNSALCWHQLAQSKKTLTLILFQQSAQNTRSTIFVVTVGMTTVALFDMGIIASLVHMLRSDSLARLCAWFIVIHTWTHRQNIQILQWAAERENRWKMQGKLLQSLGRGVQMFKLLRVSYSTLCLFVYVWSLFAAVYCLSMAWKYLTSVHSSFKWGTYIQPKARPMPPPTGETLHLQMTTIIIHRTKI